MVVAVMMAGFLGSVSAVGCALLLDLPILLILAAYPAGGVVAILVASGIVLAAPQPRDILPRVSGQA